MALKCFVGIKGINLSSRFVLAPMAGVNCTSFRLLCRKCGAGMVFTQMYHCDFITSKLESEGKRAVFEHLNIISSEKPVAVQIIGSNPVNMAAAAELLQKKADMLDINLGCPDKDMVKAGCGAYYSIHPELIGDIVSPVLESAKIPVSAKIRIGWDSQSINGVSVAKELEKLGISALTVHGRTAVQKYSGKANWEIIRHIKSKLDIPVIGNGDINNSRRALEMLERTGCDYAMIGRRAMGDPGIFARCKNRQDGYDTKVSAEVPAKVPADVLAKVPADVLAKVPADVLAKVPA
ncbi:tRNA-dihydrouridine synthase family protein, partial [Candidatus Woesearchaeota archaeon]|nr:tRNA-dihydrouridine synthase family protein [Candidatus Woesearchaeota archaeon]